MGRHLNREDGDIVASSTADSEILVEVALTTGVLEIEDEEAVVLSMVHDILNERINYNWIHKK